ncbi:hypothetical protein SKAU_G00121420 [Synaphobranchus kaupii]|uniref:Neuronal-specific septin-3 n=1 Tax=Synaphobranchus kaupii TaxID=118154 RepID=A0A9Q1FNK9_SYNKA|nr:hypothetical protein SKAU_G00121420 [Synaphobranchus kaupii]
MSTYEPERRPSAPPKAPPTPPSPRLPLRLSSPVIRKKAIQISSFSDRGLLLPRPTQRLSPAVSKKAFPSPSPCESYVSSLHPASSPDSKYGTRTHVKPKVSAGSTQAIKTPQPAVYVSSLSHQTAAPKKDRPSALLTYKSRVSSALVTGLQGGLIAATKNQESRLSPALSKKMRSVAIPVFDNRVQEGQTREHLPEATDCKTTSGRDLLLKLTRCGPVRSTKVPIVRHRSPSLGLHFSGEPLKGISPEAEACQTKSRAESSHLNQAESGIEKSGGTPESIPKPLLREGWNLQEEPSKRHSELGKKDRDHQLRLIQTGNTRAKQNILKSQGCRTSKAEAQDSEGNLHSPHLPFKSKRSEHIPQFSTRLPQTIKEKFLTGLPRPTVKIQDTKSHLSLADPSKKCLPTLPQHWQDSKEQNQKNPLMPQLNEKFNKQRLALNSASSQELTTVCSQPQCKEITPDSVAQSFLHTNKQDPLPLPLESAGVDGSEMISQDAEYMEYKQLPHTHKKRELFQCSNNTDSESSYCDKTAPIKDRHTGREGNSGDTCFPAPERGHIGNSSPRLQHRLQQQTKIPDFSEKRRFRRRNLHHTDGVANRGFLASMIPNGGQSKTMDSAKGIINQNQLTLNTVKQEHSLCDHFGPTDCENKTEHVVGHNPEDKPDFCPDMFATEIIKNNDGVPKLSHSEPTQTGPQSYHETDYSADEWTVRWLLSIDQNQPKMSQSCTDSREVSKTRSNEIRCSSLHGLDPPPSSSVLASEKSNQFPEPSVHAKGGLALKDMSEIVPPEVRPKPAVPAKPPHVSQPPTSTHSSQGSGVGGQGSALLGYIGIDTIIEQMRKKTMKTGFDFNIMIVGHSGLGKSTLVNTLFKSQVSRRSTGWSRDEKIPKTVEIKSVSHVIEEGGVKMKLTVIDTPGFGDQINNENCWEPISKYINEQYEKFLKEEVNIARKKRIPDTRVHCCVYFISPTGHSLRQLDIEFMKHLSRVVNIIPVIAKSDTLTLEEKNEFKQKVRKELEMCGIEFYPQKEFDEDMEDKSDNDKIREAMPFAVVGSDKEYQVNGKRILGRKTAWGVVEVENPTHCEFAQLRDFLIRSHLQDLKEVTHNIHYETYRAKRLNDNGGLHPIPTSAANDTQESNLLGGRNGLVKSSNLKTKGQEMDTADQDEAQSKKVFRARKTMKISDRLQLESIHNSHSSSALPSSSAASCSSTPPPAVLNGKYPEEEQTEDQKVRESHTDSNPKETRPTPPVPRTPSPLTLSLSLSPSPPSQSPEKLSYSNACLSPAHSPNSVGKESDGKERDDEEEKTSSLLGGVEAGDDKKTEEGEVKEKEDSAGSQVKDEEDENPKPDGDVSSPLDSPQDPAVSSVPPLASETKDKENKIETEKRTESEEAVAMDTDPAPMETKALEVDKSTPAADAISSTSPSLSPSHAPESDLEVKEGFLVLSEEDENQGEKDEAKVKEEVKIEAGEEMEVDVKKEVDMKKEEDREDIKDTAPPSPTSSPEPPPSADPEADKCHTNLCGKKRALCGDVETDREKEKGEEEEGLVRDGKRLKVEGEELEAQLELKIRADTSSRLKLEKVVQQLVEEQLRVLQLSVFDRSLQELRERVEKIDCATKHQQTLNTLQAKISRLAKKFGAANQTKENIQKPQEGTSLTPATNTLPISATSTTSTFRSVRTTVDSKPTNPKPKANPLNATVSEVLLELDWSDSCEEGESSEAESNDSVADAAFEGMDPLLDTEDRAESDEKWKSEDDPDTEPPPFPFCPTRTPGPQLDITKTYSPLELFQMFFSESVLQTLCANTNKQGERRRARGKKTYWFPVSVQEMYRYLSVVVYMGLMMSSNISTYWSRHRLYRLAFTKSVMPKRRFEAITWTLHMSNPMEDVHNDRKRETPAYDRLFRLRPLLDQIVAACRAFYHPHQAVAVDERIVEFKNRIGLKECMKDKTCKWAFKLFALADSRNGYTCNFNIYQGKLFSATGKGLSFDAVVDLLDVEHLGTGYHIYVDNFYTSAALFRHLHQLRYGACGTVRPNRLSVPCPKENGLPRNADRCAIRWLRDGPLLYTKWMDSGEVTMCSTIHKVLSGDSVQRRVWHHDGTWTTRQIPVPAPVKAYNTFMGEVDLSDALQKLYSVAQRTHKWYKKLFYHFVDIAVVNSFILHKEMALEKGESPLTQRQFREELCVQLGDCGRTAAPEWPMASGGTEASAPGKNYATEYEVECNPVTIVNTSLTIPYFRSTVGRKYCVLCTQKKHRNKTIWKSSPAQPKPLSTPTPPASSPMVSAPVPLLITTTTASGTTSSVSSLAPVTSQNQTGTLLLKTTLANNNGVSQSGPMSAAQSVSLQPLLIQLPLAVTGAQGGSVVTNHNAGVELIPVSSLGTVGTLNKAKTTTATTYILQKTTPSSSASSLPLSPSLPQITLARAVYPGGSGTVSVPSSGVSVSTARTPTQCVSVVGVTSSSSLPVSSAPAATGGQATVGPPSATVMASKTDNQAAGKPSAQVSRASSSRAVIDLTEDDDDVQVTGVQKAPVQSGLNAALSVSPATQHSTGAPPPLISSTTQLGPGSTIRSSPQGGLHSVNGPPVAVPYRSPQNSPSKIRPANPSHQLPPLPSLPPAPTRLPPEATHSSLPQQPQLKLTRVQNQNGIVLSWFVEETDRTCAAVDSYHLYAFHRDHAGAPQSQWKKIGEVKALPLPMACTLTQFVSGSTYYFAVCARDIYSRFGPFCEPQCTDVISSSPSS